MNNKYFLFVKNNILPIALFFGIVFHDFFGQAWLTQILPYNLFMMLLFSFSKISVRDLKPKKVHFILLAFVLILSFGAYSLLRRVDVTLAESVLVIAMTPTATAAVVVVSKLDGNAANVVSYTIVSNVAVSILIPLLFPMIHPQEGKTFWEGVLAILQTVFPMLVIPMIISELMKRFVPKVSQFMVKYNSLSFYIWASSLLILMGKTVNGIIDKIHKEDSWILVVLLALGSMGVCIALYVAGKWIGTKWDERVSCGQAIGQKNTIFTMWVGNNYLDPATAIGCGFYIFWQNLFNSWQLQRKRKKDALEKAAQDLKK
ncbi:MAG: bile acid:sodium symporter [Bacteroidales bacterium]|nr:bile acid:sodium symporter [Bacteroidales bacterium]